MAYSFRVLQGVKIELHVPFLLAHMYHICTCVQSSYKLHFLGEQALKKIMYKIFNYIIPAYFEFFLLLDIPISVLNLCNKYYYFIWETNFKRLNRFQFVCINSKPQASEEKHVTRSNSDLKNAFNAVSCSFLPRACAKIPLSDSKVGNVDKVNGI